MCDGCVPGAVASAELAVAEALVYVTQGRVATPTQASQASLALGDDHDGEADVFVAVKDIAERADAPAKKARVVLSFLKEVGFAAEAPGARFAPLATEPPSLERLRVFDLVRGRDERP